MRGIFWFGDLEQLQRTIILATRGSEVAWNSKVFAAGDAARLTG